MILIQWREAVRIGFFRCHAHIDALVSAQYKVKENEIVAGTLDGERNGIPDSWLTIPVRISPRKEMGWTLATAPKA